MTAVTLHLPWPPSVNDYWVGMGRGRHIGARGKAFREEVFWIVRRARANGAFGERRLSVVIRCCEPMMKRRRDLDNLGKATMDALKHAEVYADDSQIDHLELTRCEAGAGVLEVRISEWSPVSD